MTTPDEIRKLVDIANALVWKEPNLRVLRPEMKEEEYSTLARLLQMQIEASHARGKLLLPDLSAYGNGTIGVFSDYSGEGAGDYFTYSFLVCALDLTWCVRWEDEGGTNEAWAR